MAVLRQRPKLATALISVCSQAKGPGAIASSQFKRILVYLGYKRVPPPPPPPPNFGKYPCSLQCTRSWDACAGYVLRVLQRGHVQVNVFHHNAAISCPLAPAIRSCRYLVVFTVHHQSPVSRLGCQNWQWQQAADMLFGSDLELHWGGTAGYPFSAF